MMRVGSRAAPVVAIAVVLAAAGCSDSTGQDGEQASDEATAVVRQPLAAVVSQTGIAVIDEDGDHTTIEDTVPEEVFGLRFVDTHTIAWLALDDIDEPTSVVLRFLDTGVRAELRLPDGKAVSTFAAADRHLFADDGDGRLFVADLRRIRRARGESEMRPILASESDRGGGISAGGKTGVVFSRPTPEAGVDRAPLEHLFITHDGTVSRLGDDTDLLIWARPVPRPASVDVSGSVFAYVADVGDLYEGTARVFRRALPSGEVLDTPELPVESACFAVRSLEWGQEGHLLLAVAGVAGECVVDTETVMARGLELAEDGWTDTGLTASWWDRLEDGSLLFVRPDSLEVRDHFSNWDPTGDLVLMTPSGDERVLASGVVSAATPP